MSQLTKTFDAKKMLKTANAQKKKIRYNERKKVEIIAKTKHYKVGQRIKPHLLMAEALIEQKIAKAVK